MYAIVFDRNKQYFVKKGLVLKVDLMKKKIGEIVEFDKILFFCEENHSFVGDPFVKNKVVLSKVVNEVKGDKKLILKFKRRKHHMKKQGHRQKYTLLEIISIEDK